MGKVILKIAGAVCIIVLFGGSAYVVGKYLDISQQPYHVSNTPVNLKSTVGENANNCQRNAHVEIFPVGETLYYYVRSWPWSLGTRSKFDKQVCTIVDGELNDIGLGLYDRAQPAAVRDVRGLLLFRPVGQGEKCSKNIKFCENFS